MRHEETTGPAYARERTAADRTVLLHRMLVIRHTGLLHRPPAPPGIEAILAGIGAALAPGDRIMVIGGPSGPTAARPAVPGVTVQLAHFAGNGGPEGICALFAHHPHDRIRRTLTVDGWDVEAVATAAASAVRSVRTSDAAQLLTLPIRCGRRRYDPAEVLADRMRGARQLDENALAAITADARRIAGRMLHDHGGAAAGITLSALAVTADELAPCFAVPNPQRRDRAWAGSPSGTGPNAAVAYPR